jgi:hypothetical protein
MGEQDLISGASRVIATGLLLVVGFGCALVLMAFV